MIVWVGSATSSTGSAAGSPPATSSTSTSSSTPTSSSTSSSTSVSASAGAAGSATAVAGPDASTTIVAAARSPIRWRRSPVTSITISPTMYMPMPSMTLRIVRTAISRIPAGAPSARTTRSFRSFLPTVWPPPDSRAK